MSKSKKSSLTIEDLMDLKGDLETLDADALDNLVEELINLKETTSFQESEITRLEANSMTDRLTGTVTRRVLEQEIGRSLALARRHGRRSALVLLDLDDFKSINTHFGREVGDKALAHIASVLMQNIRPTDVVSRSGDDEFAILLNEIRTLDDTLARAEELLRLVTETPCMLKGRSICVSACMGFCFFGPEYDIEGIIETAEADMKRRGSNG